MPAPAASQRQPPIARIDHWPSPTAGWNANENISALQPTDAMRLDNFVADLTNVRLRRGSILHTTVASATPVRSLMVYNSAAKNQLLAVAGGSSAQIFDVTTAGSSTSIVAGLGSDVIQYVNFSTPGGQFLIAVNGTTTQYVYDGTTWTTATNTWGTGVTATTFSTVAAFENRLFFTSPTGLGLYYLPATVFQGEIHMLDLGGYLPKGGVITLLGTWTRDNGFGGMDDLLVVVTNQGEVLMFSGIDPDVSSGWSMIGRFVVGRPVSGHRALARLGPDLMLICEDGFQPLARYLSLGESQSLTMASPYSVLGITAISRKIGNAVTAAVKAAASAFGWEAVLYPANNVLLVNVPQPGGGGFQQYVVNTINGAWSRFLGLQSYCWAIFQGGIYFGSDNGVIVQADTGGDDQGQPIAFDLVTSFQLLGQSAQQKRATMCRPFITANGLSVPQLDVNVDYNLGAVTSPLASEIDNTYWDKFNWDQANWAAEGIVQNNWYSVDGLGTAFAIRMTGAAKTTSMSLWAFDIAFESGVGFI